MKHKWTIDIQKPHLHRNMLSVLPQWQRGAFRQLASAGDNSMKCCFAIDKC